MSAALDAVKENVLLPWSTTVPCIPHVSSEASQSPLDPTLPSDDEPPQIRILRLQNFTKALKEITPSSSEALGSLAELRKWNDEFGEGRRDKRRKQVWGKDRFGFTDTGHRRGDDGKVLHSLSDISTSNGPKGLQ